MSASDITGFKLRFTERDHRPTAMPSAPLLHGGIIDSSVPPDTSIILGERGRKNFDPKYCAPSDWRAAKRQLPHKTNSDLEQKPGGKRLIPHPTKDNFELVPTGKAHFPTPRSDVERRNPNFSRKKSVLQPTEPSEYNLEVSMNRKQRIQEERQKRNDIAAATPGDKSYKNADREPGFYAEGGLVTGSTIALKKSGKPTLQKREDIRTGPPKKLEATYGKLMERLAREYDQNQVSSLTVASTDFQGQVVPSWEEKTGNHLVDPDDDSVY
mmetsp:Transcript_23343/g.38897  ORF Transcript_23343/g.38897 Transcript_23343/m.38897 type:complete len:269 (+) Transcript_23343:73-879(+)